MIGVVKPPAKLAQPFSQHPAVCCKHIMIYENFCTFNSNTMTGHEKIKDSAKKYYKILFHKQKNEITFSALIKCKLYQNFIAIDLA